jgi:hypothetical protein
VRRLLKSRPIATTLALAAVVAGYWTWAAWAGSQKLTSAEVARAAELSGNPDKLDLKIILPFTPEQFHFMRLQDIGRMAGADTNSINLRGVRIDDARALARQYWVSDIVPLETQ